MKDRETDIETVLGHVRNGASLKTSCHCAGLGRATFYRWLNEDASLKPRLNRALSECKLFHIKNIQAHSAKDWKASAWYLERRYPQEFGRREPDSIKANQPTKPVDEPSGVIPLADIKAAAEILEGLGFRFKNVEPQ